MKKTIILFAVALVTLCSCCNTGNAGNPKNPATGDAIVKSGLEVLVDNDFEPLKGKKIGLLTNPSGVDRNLNSAIDILFNAEGVELVKLFAPEHGVRGDIYAGGHADDSVDEKTGLPVLSIYGKTLKPTPEMLEGLNAVVYDIQDVGARSYTFISSSV